MMRQIFPYLALPFLLFGCAVNAPVTNQAAITTTATTRIQVASATPNALPSPTAQGKVKSPAPAATAEPPKATQPANLPVLTQTSGGLTVQVFSDSDVEVSTAKYFVSGSAPAGTVLSINDEIIVVDQSQAFSVGISLEDGPNLIEIVASDTEGNEVSFMLTVSYSSQS